MLNFTLKESIENHRKMLREELELDVVNDISCEPFNTGKLHYSSNRHGDDVYNCIEERCTPIQGEQDDQN